VHSSGGVRRSRQVTGDIKPQIVRSLPGRGWLVGPGAEQDSFLTYRFGNFLNMGRTARSVRRGPGRRAGGAAPATQASGRWRPAAARARRCSAAVSL